MAVTKKIIGWGKDSIVETIGGQATTYADIVINSTALSVEEGDEIEAQIEGGEAEARRRQADKYTLVAERRIDDPTEVNSVIGFVDEVDSVQVIPEGNNAVGVTLIKPSRHVAVSFDTTDGLKAIYTYKTRGTTDSTGKLTDITFQKKTSNSYTAVSTSIEDYENKNPMAEGWFIKNGDAYMTAYDTEVVEGRTYYTLG